MRDSDNESLNVYFIIMKQLCFRNNAENAALMQCVINGMKDPVFKKYFVNGCSIIYEFKKREKSRLDYENV